MEIAKRMTSRALLVAAAAIAVAVAIVAVLPATPASAQSDGETAGRIVARLLDDGRVEFGWQSADGARVLPRQRYFPTNARVDRWLRSSPVEVGGAEIGRINARLLDDGRIEFGFTPTDGERIAPQARYFPTSARVDRWLRSTEITIGPPAATSGYIAVGAGVWHTCAIRASDSAIQCWGSNRPYGQTDAPDGRFSAVSNGGAHTCAIRASDGAIQCWGYGRAGEAPAGSFSAVSAGDAHNCAIRASDGAIECWGDNSRGQTNAPDGRFTAISAGSSYTCAIRASDGAIECWGNPHVPDDYGQTNAPDGRFTAISASASRYACGIRASDSAIQCWGWEGSREQEYYGQVDAPDGRFTAINITGSYACAIRASDGAIECWGNDAYGQATPPTE